MKKQVRPGVTAPVQCFFRHPRAAGFLVIVVLGCGEIELEGRRVLLDKGQKLFAVQEVGDEEGFRIHGMWKK